MAHKTYWGIDAGTWGEAVGRGLAALLTALGALLMGAGTAGAEVSSVIGQWRFDEPAGQTVVDDGLLGLDGRLGATDGVDAADPTRIPGVSGGALHFDAKTYVRLPTTTALEPATLTVEAVVRAAGSPGHFRYIVSRGSEGCEAASYGLYTAAAGGIAFYVYNGTSYRVSATAMPSDVWNGQWHHVAGVFDGAFLRLYVDGHPVGAPQPAPPEIAYTLGSPDTYFGTYQGTCALPLNGDVDMVRIWRGPLAPDFIGSLSDAALNPPPVVPPPTSEPASLPTATAADSDASAAASRSTLTPAQAGQTLTSATGKPAPQARGGARRSGAGVRHQAVDQEAPRGAQGVADRARRAARQAAQGRQGRRDRGQVAQAAGLGQHGARRQGQVEGQALAPRDRDRQGAGPAGLRDRQRAGRQALGADRPAAASAASRRPWA